MPANRWHSPSAAVYALVDETPGAVLLEGARPGPSQRIEAPQQEPWTRLFLAPLQVCVAHRPGQIAGLFVEIERAVAAGLSAAGFFSYECGLAFEPKAGMRPPRGGMPLAWFGIYERGYVFDHGGGEFVGGAPPGLEAAKSRLASGPDFPCAADADRKGLPLAADESAAASFAIPEPVYARRIAAIHEFIRAGDVYQLNFTAPLRAPAPGSAAAFYARLRGSQPAAYGAFLHWQPGRRILSFSPELFFRVDTEQTSRRIVTRPMKGTARRGRTTGEDRAIAEWLRNDAKNRSENLMIVDLVRNDLGRVARFGSVHTEKLFAVERLPTLWQMTSSVTAELRPDVGFEAIFRALFPCGSVTGAPKVRAMQLIGELEDEPRGIYTGAIGFFSPRQTVFNVAIRTLELDGEQGAMGVGSGIVIDSDPAAEYRECLLKAEFLTRSARPRFSLLESLLWENGYPLLDVHLDRLEDSAQYFDFPCARAEVKAALETRAQEFADQKARKVRLLLDADGEIQITFEPLAFASGPNLTHDCDPVRGGAANESKDLRWSSCAAALLAGRPASESIGLVRIAAERTDPADPMLFHKTTHRPLYSRAFAEAQRSGFDDVLFSNTRGELTEGAISNVFVEKDGRWFTPPIECGLLPGVYRRYLLQVRAEMEERVLGEDDLRNADAIYLANAVRGLRKVALAK